MPKLYRVSIEEIDSGGSRVRSICNYEDFGFYVSRELKALARRLNEPAPVVKLEGQTEMDLA